MITKRLTADEIELYEIIKGGRVTAVYSSRASGSGWRPVCRGRFLGQARYGKDSIAVHMGKQFMFDLQTRANQAFAVVKTSASKPAQRSRKSNGRAK